ncbi:hypothetical protein LCGC14_2268450 [marine sediment metagenome]|uniref:DUF7736 domain-containing protein n=1 Tax=marine sediment metagenome TaxID=412755 RepID=A0A0F9DJX4_9ZZZZ
MTNVRKFPLGTVLTVTTGRLLTKSNNKSDNGIGDLYEILKHMTGEAPLTHTLGIFVDKCKPQILLWYPELDSPELTVLGLGELSLMLENQKNNRDLIVAGWLSGLVTKGICSAEYDIGQRGGCVESKNN